MDYEGIFYCVKCDMPKHILKIMKREPCECGNIGFISLINFDITEILNEEYNDRQTSS